MSTKISSIYDALVTRLETVLPNHARLSNPYDSADNMSQALYQGWGLRIEGGSNSERTASCQLSVVRNLSVILTRRFFTLELDPTARSTTEKDLLEDHFLVIEDFENDHTVISDMIAIKWVSDSGIETINTDTETFIQIVINFEVEYMEDIT